MNCESVVVEEIIIHSHVVPNLYYFNSSVECFHTTVSIQNKNLQNIKILSSTKERGFLQWWHEELFWVPQMTFQ